MKKTNSYKLSLSVSNETGVIGALSNTTAVTELEIDEIMYPGDFKYISIYLWNLFEDDDNIFGGGIPILSDYKIINVNIVVGGDIVDLVDEVILASARGALIGKHGVPTQEDTA